MMWGNFRGTAVEIHTPRSSPSDDRRRTGDDFEHALCLYFHMELNNVLLRFKDVCLST